MVLSGLPRARILIAVGSSSGSGKDEERVVDINGHCVIGRATDVDFRITEPSVSRHHVRLSVVMEKEGKRLQIADLESANGTYVNGQRIAAARTLSVGDTVELGTTRLRLRQIL
jgi:pSer/pThr/pTyr-binding forkhead associated (FHA) protein